MLAVTANLVADIGTGDSSKPANLVEVGGLAFFTANDGFHGVELWKSDGTEAGTETVRDIRGGDSTSSSNPKNLTRVGDVLYFVADDGAHGAELWRADGTPNGTTMVRELVSGSSDASIADLTNLNGTLYFSAQVGSSGRALWKSDGTSVGTVMVQGTSGLSPHNLVSAGGLLFFTSGTSDRDLWRSDGTAAGTFLLKGGVVPGAMTAFGGELFFRGTDATHGQELWKSAGTIAGTQLVADLVPGVNGSSPTSLTDVNGTLFFAAVAPGSFGLTYVWKSDGTPEGTVVLHDAASHSPIYTFGTNPITNLNGEALFRGFLNPQSGGLWTSDGTDQGTTFVGSLGVSFGPLPVNLNGAAYFLSADSTHGTELWKSDGTAAGSDIVADIYPGPPSSLPGSLVIVGAMLLFTADDGIHGQELWRSDGTPQGTALVRDINARTQTSSFAGQLAALGSTAFFTATDRQHGAELWKSNGTPDGTVLVSDIQPGQSGSSISEMTAVGGSLFFTADDGVHGVELWKSDGVTTTLVSDIRLGSLGSTPHALTNVNGTLYFAANDGSAADKSFADLWKSDGTPEGTVLVKRFSQWSSPREFLNFGGTLYFVAHDGVHGYELWKSDGSDQGTVMVADISPGPASGSPTELTSANGVLLFKATDGDGTVPGLNGNGYELWRSDGTEAGTWMVKDINPGSDQEGNFQIPRSSEPSLLTDVGGTVFFFADDNVHGFELWQTDGTSDGTVLVKDQTPGGNSPSGPSISELINVNGTLFYMSQAQGTQLMRSDGTAAGTFAVKTITNLTSTNRYLLTNIDGTLFFQGNTGAQRGLWTSDGTPSGTIMVSPNFDDVQSLVNVNGRLFFSANDGNSGKELWTVPPRPPVASLFYNHSAFDNQSAGVSDADDAAIAPDKKAYYAGSGPAAFADISSYSAGINGIMVDLAGSHPDVTAADFDFKVGNNNSPGAWANGPAPLSVSVRAGAGGAAPIASN